MESNQVQDNEMEAQMQAAMALANTKKRIKTGANWFYWIAGLSLVNTGIQLFGGTISFVVGLGITLLVDGVAQYAAEDYPEAGLIFIIIGLVISLFIIAIFAFFGFMANKGKKWAFIAGMGLYALDAIFVIFLGDFFMFGFHLFGLAGLWGGLKALNSLQKAGQSLEKAQPSVIEKA